MQKCLASFRYSQEFFDMSTAGLTSSIVVKDECRVDSSGFQSILKRLAD